MIDDIKVEATPTGAPFDGVSTVAFGSIYDINPDKQATYAIRNIGAETLTLSQASASDEITLEGASQTLEPGEAATITVTLNTTTVGVYNGNFMLNTNDANNATVTVDVTATILAATLTEYHYQDFNRLFNQCRKRRWQKRIVPNCSCRIPTAIYNPFCRNGNRPCCQLFV
jgi:hypothetical protein